MKFTLKELEVIKEVLTDVLSMEDYEYEDTEEIVKILDRIDEETNLD